MTATIPTSTGSIPPRVRFPSTSPCATADRRGRSPRCSPSSPENPQDEVSQAPCVSVDHAVECDRELAVMALELTELRVHGLHLVVALLERFVRLEEPIVGRGLPHRQPYAVLVDGRPFGGPQRLLYLVRDRERPVAFTDQRGGSPAEAPLGDRSAAE